MGQANKRGTYEQRKAQAIANKSVLLTAIENNKSSATNQRPIQPRTTLDSRLVLAAIAASARR